MSFPRAAIKRFYESTDNSIPPPGSYDPKFATDVAAASMSKSSSNYDKWVANHPCKTNNGNGSIMAAGATTAESRGVIPVSGPSSSMRTKISDAGNERKITSRFSFNHSPVARQNSSNTSFGRLTQRRSSSTGIMAKSRESISELKRRSNSRVASRSFIKSGIPRIRSPSSIRTSGSSIRRVPSSVPSARADPPKAPKGVLKGEGVFHKPQKNDLHHDQCENNGPQQLTYVELEPGEIPPSILHSAPLKQKSNTYICITRSNNVPKGASPSAINIFDEIQSLAESLQNELSEYKLKLGKERIRSQELEAKKLELEFINHSLKKQLEKYECAKESWEQGEFDSRSRLETLIIEKEELEEKVKQLQEKLNFMEESEFRLQEHVTCLEEEKRQWSQEKMELQISVEGLQKTVKDEEIRRNDVESKIKELEAQMDACYHTCESRMADAENMKETYEVKIQELSEQVQEYLGKLEGMTRELETQKTLMNLMKMEYTEENHNKIKVDEVEDEPSKGEELNPECEEDANLPSKKYEFMYN